jgi:hypothetical protein
LDRTSLVFNPMSASEVIQAVGGVLKSAAGQDGEDAYRRGQLLSAYSVCRHLAAEESARPELRSWFEDELEPILAARGEEWPRGAEPTEVGERLSTLMAALRAAGDAESRQTATALRGVLRDLSDREIDALAAAE